MNHTSAELSEINDKLKAMIADENAQIRLVVQTGYDETGMIATADGYLRLAQVLVGFVLSAETQGPEKWDVYGRTIRGSTAIRGLFRENHEVCIDTTMLAETEEEVSHIAEAFWRGSPPQEQPPV